MEGAAVAQVCSLNEVPFVIVRVISDFANESTHQQLVHSFAKVSSIPGQVAMEMLKQVH
jgi:adenosylhomocysteine nucleosidase